MSQDRPRNNVITVRGRLPFAPDIRDNVVSFKLTVQSYRKKKGAAADDKYPYQTNWFRVVCWGNNKDIARSLVKGDFVVATGSLEIDEWSSGGKSGVSVEVHVTEIARDDSRAPAAPRQQEQPSGRQVTERAPKVAPSFVDDEAGPEFEDSEIPF